MRNAWKIAVAIAVPLLVGCGAVHARNLVRPPERPAKLWPTASTPDGRFTIDHPHDWDVGLLGPDQQLVIASYPLPAGPPTSWWLDRARAALPNDGALILIFDYGDLQNDAERLFPPRPAQLHLDDSTYAEYEGFGSGYLLKFADHQRAVQIMVARGDRATPATTMEVLRTINSLRVRPLN